MDKAKKFLSGSILLLSLSLCSCSHADNQGNKNELVMSQGMIIKATNSNGLITIEAGKGLERVYSWDSKNVRVEMLYRDKRWYGSLGIYKPGGADIHTVVEEGQQHFCSEKEVLEWLTWQNKTMPYVYTGNGLAVGWYYTKDPNSPSSALIVEVWQCYVNGNKPVGLAEAKDNLVEVTFKEGTAPQLVPVGKFQPSSPKTINGRLYSGKAIDIMKERDISAKQIEKCISTGEHRQDGEYIIYSQIGDFFFLCVQLDKVNRVVRVGQ